MSAQLEFFDSDGSTIITTYNLGSVATPGSSTNKKFFVDNFGDQTAQSLTVSLEAVGTNDGDDYALLATDSGGSPGSFGVGPISLGNLSASTSIAFWTRVTLPSGITPDGNPRRYNLLASALSI